jgi:biotin carboxyl carrier protein
MKKYRVKVNGKVYEVELEAVEEVKGSIEAPKAAAPVAAAPAAGDQNILAPIGGKVLDIKVKVGDKVQKGDVLLIVEAMKLENEVVSPFEGQVAEILVSKGQNVKAKEPIVIIE